MRDWTRAVVFGGWGAVPARQATGACFPGDQRKRHGFQAGCPRSGRWRHNHQRMPSHPSVRHYDRSEPMRLTNPWRGQAAAQTGPFEASRPAVSPQPERERSGPGPSAGSLIEKSAQGAPRGDHPNTTIAPKRRPPPLRGQRRPINPARFRVRDEGRSVATSFTSEGCSVGGMVLF